jgi:5-methylcytosine-specific restriction endonuclease McrBC regulatory subunit McrC
MESNYVEVIPHHDFIGIFFVSSFEETTLYAVVPRFWHTNITDELRSFNGINLRILTQNKPTKLPQSEADAVSSQMNRIKKVYSEESISNDENEEPVPQQAVGHYEDVEILKALLVLCEFYNTNNRKNPHFEVSSTGDSLLLVAKIVQTLEENLVELTRTYSNIVEKTDSVRGKITPRGMMMMVAQPSTRLECEFQKFDVQSPIYRVLATVLDLIVSNDLPNYLDIIDDSFRDLGPRASFLRGKLSMIRPYSVQEALQHTISLSRSLPRKFSHYRELIDLSELYLSHKNIDFSVLGDPLDLFHITAPTSKVWEKIVETGLNSSEFVTYVDEQGNRTDNGQSGLNGPWVSKNENLNRKKKIDLKIHLEDKSFILGDAKYAIAKEMPKSGYQYQQFFYLHAYQKLSGLSPKCMSLIHPISLGKDSSVKSILSLEGYLRNQSKDVPWLIVELPFPQIDDLLDEYWEDRFFTNMASEIETTLLDNP